MAEIIQGDVLDGFVTRAQAMSILGCTRGNIYYHVQKGNLEEYDAGGMNMLKLADVNRLKLERLEAAVVAVKRQMAANEA